MSNTEFSKLFKKYRLKSGLATLSEFGDLLSEKGVIYENSIFSHWQNGTRIPKDRDTLLKLIQIFVDKKGIKSLEESNKFIQLAGQGYLTESEINLLCLKKMTSPVFLAPRNLPSFIGREIEINQILELIKSGKTILIQGPAGYGKTSLAIKIAHLSKNLFPDGIFWFKMDTLKTSHVLGSIVDILNPEFKNSPHSSVQNQFTHLINTQKILIILDNVEEDQDICSLFPSVGESSVIVTSRYKSIKRTVFDKTIFLETFTQRECQFLFKQVLGENYYNDHCDELSILADLIGFLPLGVSLISQHLLFPYNNPKNYIFEIKHKKLELKEFSYDNKDLVSVILLSTQGLSQHELSIFSLFGGFQGESISLETISYIYNLENFEIEKSLRNLIDKSLVSYAQDGRYRVHQW